MQIIRDEKLFGLAMIPLFLEWGVRRCNVKGCKAKPTTIIAGHKEVGAVYGLCEEHFQQGNALGGSRLTLVWDNYDAFKQCERIDNERN